MENQKHFLRKWNISNILISGAVILAIGFMASMSFFALKGCKRDDNNYYQVYYVKTEESQLVSKKVNIEEDTTVEILEGLLLRMNELPKDKNMSIIKPENVSNPMVDIENDIAVLSFDNTYNDMDVATEVLYRAAVVKMLTQLDEIKYVRFIISGSEAVYPDGRLIGLMTASDFIDDSEQKAQDVEWITVSLFFSNKNGDALKKVKENICYNKNSSIEKIVVEKIIKGVSAEGVYPTVPSDMKLLSVSTVDGICYVNISDQFSKELVNTKADVTVYSIVNSLCSLKSVKGVKILVNGESEIVYRDTINLNNVFTYNYDIVE